MTTWMDVWAQKQSKDSYYNNNSRSSSSNGKYNNTQYQLSVGSDADCADLYDDDDAEADVVSQQRCSPTLVNAHRLTHTDTRTRTYTQTHTHTDRQWARIKFVRACKRECAAYVCVCVWLTVRCIGVGVGLCVIFVFDSGCYFFLAKPVLSQQQQ